MLSGHRGAGRNHRASDYWRSLEKHRFYSLRSGGRYWDRTSDHIDHVSHIVEIPTWFEYYTNGETFSRIRSHIFYQILSHFTYLDSVELDYCYVKCLGLV